MNLIFKRKIIEIWNSFRYHSPLYPPPSTIGLMFHLDMKFNSSLCGRQHCAEERVNWGSNNWFTTSILVLNCTSHISSEPQVVCCCFFFLIYRMDIIISYMCHKAISRQYSPCKAFLQNSKHY